jgi:hypothetical protein
MMPTTITDTQPQTQHPQPDFLGAAATVSDAGFDASYTFDMGHYLEGEFQNGDHPNRQVLTPFGAHRYQKNIARRAATVNRD